MFSLTRPDGLTQYYILDTHYVEIANDRLSARDIGKGKYVDRVQFGRLRRANLNVENLNPACLPAFHVIRSSAFALKGFQPRARENCHALKPRGPTHTDLRVSRIGRSFSY